MASQRSTFSTLATQVRTTLQLHQLHLLRVLALPLPPGGKLAGPVQSLRREAAAPIPEDTQGWEVWRGKAHRALEEFDRQTYYLRTGYDVYADGRFDGSRSAEGRAEAIRARRISEMARRFWDHARSTSHLVDSFQLHADAQPWSSPVDDWLSAELPLVLDALIASVGRAFESDQAAPSLALTGEEVSVVRRAGRMLSGYPLLDDQLAASGAGEDEAAHHAPSSPHLDQIATQLRGQGFEVYDWEDSNLGPVARVVPPNDHHLHGKPIGTRGVVTYQLPSRAVVQVLVVGEREMKLGDGDAFTDKLTVVSETHEAETPTDQVERVREGDPSLAGVEVEVEGEGDGNSVVVAPEVAKGWRARLAAVKQETEEIVRQMTSDPKAHQEEIRDLAEFCHEQLHKNLRGFLEGFRQSEHLDQLEAKVRAQGFSVYGWEDSPYGPLLKVVPPTHHDLHNATLGTVQAIRVRMGIAEEEVKVVVHGHDVAPEDVPRRPSVTDEAEILHYVQRLSNRVDGFHQRFPGVDKYILMSITEFVDRKLGTERWPLASVDHTPDPASFSTHSFRLVEGDPASFHRPGMKYADPSHVEWRGTRWVDRAPMTSAERLAKARKMYANATQQAISGAEAEVMAEAVEQEEWERAKAKVCVEVGRAPTIAEIHNEIDSDHLAYPRLSRLQKVSFTHQDLKAGRGRMAVERLRDQVHPRVAPIPADPGPGDVHHELVPNLPDQPVVRGAAGNSPALVYVAGRMAEVGLAVSAWVTREVTNTVGATYPVEVAVLPRYSKINAAIRDNAKPEGYALIYLEGEDLWAIRFPDGLVVRWIESDAPESEETSAEAKSKDEKSPWVHPQGETKDQFEAGLVLDFIDYYELPRWLATPESIAQHVESDGQVHFSPVLRCDDGDTEWGLIIEVTGENAQGREARGQLDQEVRRMGHVFTVYAGESKDVVVAERQARVKYAQARADRIQSLFPSIPRPPINCLVEFLDEQLNTTSWPLHSLVPDPSGLKDHYEFQVNEHDVPSLVRRYQDGSWRVAWAKTYWSTEGMTDWRPPYPTRVTSYTLKDEESIAHFVRYYRLPGYFASSKDVKAIARGSENAKVEVSRHLSWDPDASEWTLILDIVGNTTEEASAAENRLDEAIQKSSHGVPFKATVLARAKPNAVSSVKPETPKRRSNVFGEGVVVQPMAEAATNPFDYFAHRLKVAGLTVEQWDWSTIEWNVDKDPAGRKPQPLALVDGEKLRHFFRRVEPLRGASIVEAPDHPDGIAVQFDDGLVVRVDEHHEGKPYKPLPHKRNRFQDHVMIDGKAHFVRLCDTCRVETLDKVHECGTLTRRIFQPFPELTGELEAEMAIKKRRWPAVKLLRSLGVEVVRWDHESVPFSLADERVDVAIVPEAPLRAAYAESTCLGELKPAITMGSYTTPLCMVTPQGLRIYVRFTSN